LAALRFVFVFIPEHMDQKATIAGRTFQSTSSKVVFSSNAE